MLRSLLALGLLACHTAETPDLPQRSAPDLAELWVSDDRSRPAALMLRDLRHPLASTTLLLSQDGASVYSLDEEHGDLLRYDRASDSVEATPLGAEPASVTRAGDTLFVTLRLAGLVLEVRDGQVVNERRVGSEPIGIVARPDGDRIYVAVSQDDMVLELDGQSLEVLARIPVTRQPRFLALAPDGLTLFVGSARGPGSLERVDLLTLERDPVAFPEVFRTSSEQLPMVPRVTGDPAILPLDSRPGHIRIAVPTLFADTLTPIEEFSSIIDVIEPEPEPEPEPLPVPTGYGFTAPSQTVVTVEAGRLVGAVTVFDIDPFGRVWQTRAHPMTVSYSQAGETERTGSYVTSVAFLSEDQLVGTLEADDAVALLDIGHLREAPFTHSYFDGGYRSALGAVADAGDATTGVVWDPEDEVILARGAHDHQLTTHDPSPLRIGIGHQINDDDFTPTRLLATSSVQLAQPTMDPVLYEGRALFYSGSDRSMGAGGVSCSTCHYDGRDDGMTWTFTSGQRQTPSLAGSLRDTEPVTWTSGVATIEEEVRITSRGRMGGTGASPEQAAAVVAWLESTRLPEPPSVLDAQAVERGAQVFEQAGCPACHGGEQLTDNGAHAFGTSEEAVNTPRLRGVAATGPYLMDGSAPTLRDVLEQARLPWAMGSTVDLTDEQLDDLEAYLRAL